MPSDSVSPAGTTVRPQPWRRRLFALHRWISLVLAVFWIIQATTGILTVFHWELEDALISTLHRPTDLSALEGRVRDVAPPGLGRQVTTVWTTAGLPDRYEITVVDDATKIATAVRVTGDGTVLRESDKSQRDGFDVLIGLHQKLLSGETGSWIVGFSGIFLISNILMGLFIALPRRGGWGAALKPATRGPLTAKLYSWHRALGLIAVIPALWVVSAGTTLVFQDGLGERLGAEAARVDPRPSDQPPAVGFAKAAQIALDAFPGSRLTTVVMPTPQNATYRIRVLATDEIRRAYGTSVVFVDAMSGEVLGVFPGTEAPAARAFIEGLYAAHTGEIAGTAGRLILLSVGLWLWTMIVLGVVLWARRRA